MPSSAEYQRRHRERLREQGRTQILLNLPTEDVEILDRLRAALGAANRGDVVGTLIRKVAEAGDELKTA